MNELIKITSEGKISSRELYGFLQLNWAAYARWCRMNIVQNVYAQEGIDWWGSTIMLNGKSLVNGK